MVKRFRSIIRALTLALLFCVFAPGLLHAASARQIFVLHSYSHEYAWTHGQHNGFMQTIAVDAQAEHIVNTEYLDTKRRAYDEPYANELARHLRLKYAGYKPAAIYVTDDNALLFARDHLSHVFPDAPVFFSGVNDYGVLSSLDSARFTGVFERKEVGPNIEWLLDVDKEANDLIFIGDGSNTDRAIESELRSELIPYRLRVTFVGEKRLDRALERLNKLPGKYLFLTTLGGMTDENDQVLPLRDVMKGLVLTGRIVISMEDAYIMEGVLGGSVTSGRKQGMTAARLLKTYLNGKPVVDLPPLLKSPNELIFDDRALQRYGIHLPDKLRSQVLLLHMRPSFYARNRSLILGMLVGLAAMLFLIVTGAIAILLRKNRELSHARNSAESVNLRFNQLAKQSRTVHWEVDAEGMFTYVSPVSDNVLGYRPNELVGKQRLYDLLQKDQRNIKKTDAVEHIMRREPFQGLEKIIRTKDGHLVWTLTDGVPVLNDQGTFLGYRGSSTDISDRKRMEETLSESEKRYRELSIVDELTQLYNSRQFYVQLKIELDRSNRYELPLTLLMLDIDNFKAFNDAHGHVEGDHVLGRLGRVIKRCLRETDFAYRYGGEEFTILLPMTTGGNGAATAERIRTEFKKESFSPAPAQDVHLTMSIGVAQYKPPEEMKAFVHRVDQLMYQAKKNGKDRILSDWR